MQKTDVNMYRVLLEQGLSGYWDWNIQGNEQFISTSFMNMLGYDADEKANASKEWQSYVSFEDQARVQREVESYLLDYKDKSFNSIFRMTHKNGSLVWVKTCGCVIDDMENEPLRMLGYIMDVTPVQKMQDETHQQAAQKQNRLLNFSHAVAHNLRSHSSNIRMFTELIDSLKEEKEKAFAWENLKKISRHLEESLSDLNEIIDIQNNLDHYLEEIPLLGAVKKTLEVLSAEIALQHADVQIRISEDASVPYNPSYLESVLLNLISNAIKYRHPQRKPEIKITYMDSGSRKVLEIVDNGIGIDLSRCGKKLFNIYQTFHGNKDAKGIGLFLVKSQVEAMGGSIEVESKVDTGTTFRVFFN